MKLFHESSVVVRDSEIIIASNYKNFGYVFYCTKLEK